MYSRFSFLAALIGSLTGLNSSLQAATEYIVTDLGTLGGTRSEAHGINNSGQIVGYSWGADNRKYHAYASQNGVMTNLGTLGGSHSEANAINAIGQIVGEAFLPGDQAYHAFVRQSGFMTDLGTLGGKSSEAYGINSFGQIVGSASLVGDLVTHAFVSQNGFLTDLGTLGGSSSEALGVNDSGQIVGNSWILVPNSPDDDETEHAVIIQNGVMTDLGALGGNWSHANAINAMGQIVGSATTADDQAAHAFLFWNGLMTDLGSLGGEMSEATTINISGQVVGNSLLAGNRESHAFVFDYGVMTDLNSLIDGSPGWTLLAADGINDSGQIVGTGYNPAGEAHAYLLTPVPIPPPVASIQPSSLQKSITGAGFLTATASTVISGGKKPFSYAWTVTGGGGAFSVDSPFSSVTNISASLAMCDSVKGTATLIVTDARGRQAQTTAPISFRALRIRGQVCQ